MVSESVVSSILSRVADAQGALEIGPGIGALTGPLTEACPTVVAIELDPRFIDVLASVAPLATVLRQDALEADLPSLLRGLPEPRCIVSNMPYNITGPLLGKVTECKGLFRNAVLMMQKEVGERVLAGAGSSARGSLSVSIQLQFAIAKVCDAKAGSFHPPPKVDSVVLELVPRSCDFDLERVLKVVRAGFVQPRKTLFNNLVTKFSSESVSSALAHAPKVRAHQLSNEEWVLLARNL